MNNGRKLENKIIRSYLFSNLKLYAIAMAALWITLWVLRILMPSVYTVSAFFVPIIGILIGLSVSGGLEQSQLMGFHCSRAMYSRLLMIRPILFSVLLTTFLLLTVWMGESVGQSVPMLQFIDMEEYQYLSKLELGAMNFSLLVFINSCICLDISLSQPLLSTFFSSALGQKSSKKME